MRLFNLSIGDTKARKVNGVDKVNAKDEESKPIDSIVDDLIGYLEKPDTFMRTIAPQVFAGICTLAETSTVELLLEVCIRFSCTSYAKRDTATAIPKTPGK